MSGCGNCTYKGMSTQVEDTFVGVRIGDKANLALCATGGTLFLEGDSVIVDLEGHPAFGRIEKSPMPVFKPCQKTSASAILRAATARDHDAYQGKVKKEYYARAYCRDRAGELGLGMKVSKVEFELFRKKASVFFTADGRVDFRQLVRDLANRFSARFKMVQVGARDEAQLLGGVGICGRVLCCSTWFKEFKPISIQMAKKQGLSLNPSKISGQCGRLMCCLAYENDQYKPQRAQR